MNVKKLTHLQQQPQAPKTHKKESTVRMTTRITMLWAPIEVKHTLSNQQAQLKEDETGYSNRKLCKVTFKAPCLVALNMYPTLHLLLFAQSM